MPAFVVNGPGYAAALSERSRAESWDAFGLLCFCVRVLDFWNIGCYCSPADLPNIESESFNEEIPRPPPGGMQSELKLAPGWL